MNHKIQESQRTPSSVNFCKHGALLGCVFVCAMLLSGCVRYSPWAGAVHDNDTVYAHKGYNNTDDNDQNAAVRRNMLKVKEAAEAYAAAHKGIYPASVTDEFKSYIAGQPGKKAPDSAAPENPFNHKKEWPVNGNVRNVLEARAAYPEYMENGVIEYSCLDDGYTYAIRGGGLAMRTIASLYKGTSGTLVLSNAGFASSIPTHRVEKVVLHNDEEVAQLSGISSLVGLDIKCLRLTDSGLNDMGGMENIEKLDLSGTGISSGGASALRDMTALKSLNLSDTNIDSTGLAELGLIPHLQQLILQRTPVDKQTLVELAKFQELRDLDLRETKITRSGLHDLSQLKSLETLALSGHLSDADVAALRGVPTRKLILDHCDLSKESLKKLQASGPAGRKILAQP